MDHLLSKESAPSRGDGETPSSNGGCIKTRSADICCFLRHPPTKTKARSERTAPFAFCTAPFQPHANHREPQPQDVRHQPTRNREPITPRLNNPSCRGRRARHAAVFLALATLPCHIARFTLAWKVSLLNRFSMKSSAPRLVHSASPWTPANALTTIMGRNGLALRTASRNRDPRPRRQRRRRRRVRRDSNFPKFRYATLNELWYNSCAS